MTFDTWWKRIAERNGWHSDDVVVRTRGGSVRRLTQQAYEMGLAAGQVKTGDVAPPPRHAPAWSDLLNDFFYPSR